jgi:hypothetical protein
MTEKSKERANQLLQAIRELKIEKGETHPFRIKRQLAVTRHYCRTVEPEGWRWKK